MFVYEPDAVKRRQGHALRGGGVRCDRLVRRAPSTDQWDDLEGTTHPAPLTREYHSGLNATEAGR
jgi:hypothetical protein